MVLSLLPYKNPRRDTAGVMYYYFYIIHTNQIWHGKRSLDEPAPAECEKAELISNLEAVFNSANAAFAVNFPQFFVGAFLLAFIV